MTERSREHNPTLYQRARGLRREMTPAEIILWKVLRDRRLTGFKFRRQQPVGQYIADFFCAAARLIVELDGDSHAGREVEDAVRQAALESLGYRVMRFINPQVYEDPDTVLEAIWQVCQDRTARTR